MHITRITVQVQFMFRVLFKYSRKLGDALRLETIGLKTSSSCFWSLVFPGSVLLYNTTVGSVQEAAATLIGLYKIDKGHLEYFFAVLW